MLERQVKTFQPIQRLGRGDDVAGGALWLASYVTGQTIVIDGGFTTAQRGALDSGLSYLNDVLSGV